MRLATALAAVVLVLLLCTVTAADVPETISYQGVLRDDAGEIVPDGTYHFAFRLYTAETGGSLIWTESHDLAVEDGIFNVQLGSSVSLSGLPFTDPYWLEMAIDYGATLAPRTPLETAPYAMHAATADVALAGDDDWTIGGSVIWQDEKSVGIGTFATDGLLDVAAGDEIAADFSNNTTTDQFAVRAWNLGGSGAGFFSKYVALDPPSPPAAVYAYAHDGATGGVFYSGSGVGLMTTSSGSDYAFQAMTTEPTALSANFRGGVGIAVEGQVETDAFKMATGASDGYVLTSDSAGVGTWQPGGGSGGDDGDWTVSGGDMWSTPAGDVGIGTTTPAAKLSVVATDSGAEIVELTHTGTPPRTVNIQRTLAPSSNNDVLQIVVPAGSPDGFQFIECERDGMEFQVMGDGSIFSGGGATFEGPVVLDQAPLVATSDAGPVASLTVSDPTADSVLHAEATDESGTLDGAAVYGKYIQSTDYGMGGHFLGGWKGVAGYAYSAGGSLPHYGVYGDLTP